MRYSSDHKRETRARVLTEAANQIRAHGPSGVGVADIMKRAGLTHGGFYAHFASKDALVAAAIAKMFDGARERWEHAGGLGAYIDWYLSAEHRDARETGCPIAALASELPRLPKLCRTTYADGASALTERIAHALRELGHRDTKGLASSILAELVGALSLARVEPDEARSDAILAASRRSLCTRLDLV